MKQYKFDISNPDKVLFPGSGFIKKDILEYYERISDHILPHLKNRPLMMQRFPDGIENDGFYQKNASDYFPDWIETIELSKEDGTVNHVLCNNTDTLLYLVNQGTIAFHTWLSTTEVVSNPDKLIIDLDPSQKFSQVRKAARALRDILEKFSITSFLMTTGSRGLHIVIPLDSNEDFDASRKAGRIIGRYACRINPEIFTMETYKKDRDGKLYFDIQRNAWAQTAITPYSLRPRDGAPVATPIDWDEAGDTNLKSDKYTLKNIFRRLAQKESSWKSFNRHRYNAETLFKKFEKELD